MPTTTRTVYLTDENGNPLIDEQRNLRTLSFSLMQGYSYRLVERASIVSATYAQVVGYSTATGQTIAGVENASEFDVGDFGIVQYVISDRNNTIGYVTCEVTSVGADSLTVNGIGVSVSGADGADGKDGAPGADGKDGAATVQIGTVTTGAAGSQASVTNVGADNAAILNFTIPRGDTGKQGIQGEAATIAIGQVLTGEPGTNASVENVGTANAAILNITIPRGNPGTDGTNGTDGADGAAATIQIGEVVTGESGTQASVENTGTENAAILKFTIPRGATGTPGANGQDGAPGADGKDGTNGLDALVATGLATPYIETGTSQIGLFIVVNLNRPPQAGEEVWLTTESYTMERDDEGSVVYMETGNVYSILAEFEDGSDFKDSVHGIIKECIKISGEDGITPHIGVDGYWYIGDTNTNVEAEGKDGRDGTDGVTPHIGTNGYWYIGDTNTNIKAEGPVGLSALECGEIVEQSYAPFEGMIISLTTLNRDPIQNEKIELTYRDTSTDKIYGVLGNFPDGGYVSLAHAYVVDFWQISGDNGVGVPAGGTTGQVLKKKSDTDYDTEWADESGGGSGGGGGVEIVDLGTPTFRTSNPGIQAEVILTSEQAAKLAAEPAPVVKFTLSGAGGDYPNGVYYLTKTYVLGVGLNVYTALLHIGGYDFNVLMQAGSAATIFIYPYAPTKVVANPSDNAHDTLEKLKVDDTIYAIPQGEAATIEVGEVTTGAAGTQASVTNSGTTSAAVFDFTIPRGADGASGVTDVTAGTPTEQNGYTVTPVTFNFEQGNSKTVNIQAKNGGSGGAGVQQNAIINRTASVTTADENSPDFVENGGDLWVKKITGYTPEVETLSATLSSAINYTSAAIAPNGKIYVFGGSAGLNNETLLDDIVEFDPEAQTVTTLDVTLPSRRSGTSAATALNGKIYVFGGRTAAAVTNDIVEFDPVAQNATKLGVTLPNARWATSAATAPNGKIYVFGGQDADGILNSIVEFDPVAQTVTTLDVTISIARYATSAATAPNGKIYVFGGQAEGTALNNVIEFDASSKSVKYGNVLPHYPFGSSAATAPTGKIYVFGQGTIVEFDPMTWEATTLDTTLENARFSSAATAPNGKIYVFGCDTGDDIAKFNVYATTKFAYRKIITADASGTVTAPSFNATT